MADARSHKTVQDQDVNSSFIMNEIKVQEEPNKENCREDIISSKYFVFYF